MTQQQTHIPATNSATRRAKSFGEHSRQRQLFALIVAPIIFGALAGPTLKWSVVAWWTVQVIGVLGAILAGHEHRYGWSAAARGAVAGLIAAGVVVGIHAVMTGADVKSFDAVPYLLQAAAASAVLHLIGAAPGRLRRRIEER
ncbi:hypothetical protein [Nocardia callitridis]|uniref:Uncharacterized protein n=1 Tax=Nocardia callitridis TaxID=648753 RepID=A0ABP9L330_9NOCA